MNQTALKITPEDLQKLKIAIPNLPEKEKRRITELLKTYQAEHTKRIGKNDFLGFISHVYPGYKVGPHHRRLAEIFEEIASGKKKRVIVNIAPRFGKSEMISYLAPAWFLGKYPQKKVIMASHTADLAVNFGRRVRNLVGSDSYHDIFPQVELQADSKSASRWGTNFNGEYFAIGVGGALAGRGADLFIIDDPHCLDINTEVPTPEGFKRLKDLEVGDEVFSPDGKPVRIVAKTPVYHDQPLYAVTTGDGETIRVNGAHKWSCRSGARRTVKFKDWTTNALLGRREPMHIPVTRPVEYPDAQLPVDPYVLGAWLGNGTTSLGRMTMHPDDLQFMRAQFEFAGYETTVLSDAKGSRFSFGILDFRRELIEQNLLNNKHIPVRYMTASVRQRMALLQGLMDTDGGVDSTGRCSFQNTNLGIVRAVRELLHSLGVPCTLRSYRDVRGRYATRLIDYRVNFMLEGCFRLPRKAILTRPSRRSQERSITVEATELRGDVQCITVDRPDGLFLVGRGYVVTHNSEQEAKQGRPDVFLPAWEWFQSGPIQRLMPGGAIIVVMTRWSKLDLTGQILNHMTRNDESDEWELVEFPAIMEKDGEERSLWPEFWPIEELLSKKASMDVHYWMSQYMQEPTSEEGSLIKREWWNIWEDDSPPLCEFLIMSLDTAQETNNRADYNALTTWGVFLNQEGMKMRGSEKQEEVYNIILLNSIKQRLEFPELKEMVYEEYKTWRPDAFIVEKKNSGSALYQEMRRTGLPVSEFTPGRGNDKISRVNAISDLFSSGMVWAPNRRWAHEVIEECNDFPNGRNDDLVDSTSLALLRFRQGGFVRLPSDEPEPKRAFRSRRNKGFYIGD